MSHDVEYEDENFHINSCCFESNHKYGLESRRNKTTKKIKMKKFIYCFASLAIIILFVAQGSLAGCPDGPPAPPAPPAGPPAESPPLKCIAELLGALPDIIDVAIALLKQVCDVLAPLLLDVQAILGKIL